MRRRCRIHRSASLAGGGLSAARTVAFARGEASIAARCMRHDSRQRVRELLLSVESRRVALATIAAPSRADAPRRRPVAAVRHATAAEAPATHWAGRQKARAALANATRLTTKITPFLPIFGRCQNIREDLNGAWGILPKPCSADPAWVVGQGLGKETSTSTGFPERHSSR